MLQIQSTSMKQRQVFKSDFDFNAMGIGGLKNEFATIFRRAFASRCFPQAVLKQLGIKHVRGMMMYGPPGTGKTTMARQIGKFLESREPVVSGCSYYCVIFVRLRASTS